MSLEWWVIFFWRGIKDHNWIFFRAAQTFSDSQPTIILMNVRWLERELVDKGPPLQVPACNFKSDKSAPIENLELWLQYLKGLMIYAFTIMWKRTNLTNLTFFGANTKEKTIQDDAFYRTHNVNYFLCSVFFSEMLETFGHCLMTPDSVQLDTSVLTACCGAKEWKPWGLLPSHFVYILFVVVIIA